ncbi:hypothetical protein G210_0829 [Candida maltosa Xu316]|uniref:Uncharacterized protein n=1 Tax=Candida maltosa (strain Xu316) TaxID=1245528 RepID=M3JEZ5_CANMX|nr:hypothetical protein G210_0829 [Candida maltosa Xu316]
MNDFILGEEAYKTAKKSLSSLIKRSKEDKNERTAINLIINIKIQLVKTKDYKPRIIPITNKLDEPTNKSILLITKDPSNIYRDELTKKDCPTDDLFSDIYSFKKVKCDLRVQKFLPDVLGEIFYYKNKKVPFIIQMAKPNAKISTKSKENKIKDNRCDAKYVKLQVDSIVENTSYIPNSKGDCLNITIGYTDWKVNDLLVNLNDVVDYLINDKYLPIGGIVKSLNNLGNVHVKTSESISLPVYVKSDEDGKDNGDENDSDFDF